MRYPPAGVHQALGLPGGARGVDDEQRVLAVEARRDVRARLTVDEVVPPHVAALGPRHVRGLLAGAAQDEDVLDVVEALDRGVGGGLHRDGGAAAELTVGADQELRPGVLDPEAQRLGGETPEHQAHDGPDARAGHRRDDGLGQDRQVQDDAVAVPDAELLQRVRQPADLVLQLRVGDGARVAGFALPVQGDLVPAPGGDVAVHAVHRHVQLAAGEPLRRRQRRAVEDGGERLVPLQPAGLLGPERLGVGGRALVLVRAHVGLGGERRGGGEHEVLGGGAGVRGGRAGHAVVVLLAGGGDRMSGPWPAWSPG